MMRKPPLLNLICVAMFMAFCLVAQPAWSILIDASAITDGTTHASVPGADIYANGGTFLTSSLAGVTGFFGVQEGYVDKEIDISGESIVVTFDAPQVVEYIELGLLFAINTHYDEVNEIAKIIAEVDGSDHVGLLTVGGPIGGGSDLYLGTWTGSASVPFNTSPADDTGAGVWEIFNPFGELRVTSLTFLAVESSGGEGQYNSDFALRTIATPEPATAGLLGLGLLGLAIMGRRRRD